MKKFQCNLNRDAENISPLSSSQIEKYENLRGQKLLPQDQTKIIELTNSSLEKAF